MRVIRRMDCEYTITFTLDEFDILKAMSPHGHSSVEQSLAEIIETGLLEAEQDASESED